MAERFHVNSVLGLGRIELDGPEAHHLAVVCRLRPGDSVCLFNGDGRQYPATIVEVARKHVVLDVVQVETPAVELGFRLEAAVALPKGDRAQFLVEKLTELGVTAFTPLATARSVVLPREAKLEKLERHVIEASKQCGRNVLMEIRPLTTWEDFLAGDLPTRRLLAHPGAASVTTSAPDARVFAIGPEGGFTDEESAQALERGWTTVGLGPRVLRVETAAIYLAALIGSRSPV